MALGSPSAPLLSRSTSCTASAQKASWDWVKSILTSSFLYPLPQHFITEISYIQKSGMNREKS